MKNREIILGSIAFLVIVLFLWKYMGKGKSSSLRNQVTLIDGFWNPDIVCAPISPRNDIWYPKGACEGCVTKVDQRIRYYVAGYFPFDIIQSQVEWYLSPRPRGRKEFEQSPNVPQGMESIPVERSVKDRTIDFDRIRTSVLENKTFQSLRAQKPYVLHIIRLVPVQKQDGSKYIIVSNAYLRGGVPYKIQGRVPDDVDFFTDITFVNEEILPMDEFFTGKGIYTITKDNSIVYTQNTIDAIITPNKVKYVCFPITTDDVRITIPDGKTRDVSVYARPINGLTTESFLPDRT